MFYRMVFKIILVMVFGFGMLTSNSSPKQIKYNNNQADNKLVKETPSQNYLKITKDPPIPGNYRINSVGNKISRMKSKSGPARLTAQ